MTFVKYIVIGIIECLGSIVGSGVKNHMQALVGVLALVIIFGVFFFFFLGLEKIFNFNYIVNTFLAIVATTITVIVIFAIAILIEYIIMN